jgi:cyclopropane-fatty-acyl-phospholipid synthase
MYLSSCSIGFERNDIQLHQVLAEKLPRSGLSGFPLRPTWGS